MKKALLTLAALSILILPSLTSAAQGRPGGYASVFLGVSLLDDTNVTTDVYPDTYFDRIEFDPGVYVGGTAGYDFGMIRLEGELSYRQNEMDKLTDRGNTGFDYSGVDGDVGVFTAMANAFLDLHNDSPITPYIGGGMGLATIYISETSATIDGIRQPIYAEDDESVFAYQAGVGLDIALNRQTSLDIGYRYFETEKARFNSDWEQSKSLKLQSHNVAVGFRFKF
jgi:opacity protein-like surface antigen